MDLTTRQALGLRMRNLLLAPDSPPVGSVADVVTWFGAMQAQEINSALWTLGARLPGHTLGDVSEALEDRSVVRTWPMRGTVHWVPSADAKWMLELTGAKALKGAERRRDYLGIDLAIAERAAEVLGEALSGGRRLVRSACIDLLDEAGLPAKGQASYHLIWYSSQIGVTALAPNEGKEQTLVLLDDWAPTHHRPDPEEALATLALRYFRSHGPVPVKDFAGWTGLNLTESRRAIAAAGEELVTVNVDGVEMVTAAVDDIPEAPAGEHRVVPGFDEYLLGFKDRSLMLADGYMDAVVPGNNGVFQATLVRSGRVVGTWKRKSSTAKKLTLTVFPLERLTKKDRIAFDKAFAAYADFLGQEVVTDWAPG